jgi:hypothetical protein
VRRLLVTVGLLLVIAAPCAAASKASKDSPAAAKTRKKLKQKLSVDFSDTRLEDVAETLKKEFDNKLSIKIDTIGGVSKNLTLTYSAKDKPLDKILDEMFKKVQLGYVVVSAPKASDPRNRFDGWILIKKGNQRGYEASEDSGQTKQEPDDEDKPPKDKDKKKKDKSTKDKKTKDKKKKDGEDNEKKDKGQTETDKEQQQAASKLRLAGMFERDGLIKQAKKRYQDIIKQFPNTEAAKEAKARLKKLEK